MDGRKCRKNGFNAIQALRQALDYPTPEQIALAQQIRPKGKSRIVQALAQPEQEPFGYFRYDLALEGWQETGTDDGKPLYTAPPSIEAAVLAEREACAEWLRDNYQDYKNIADICEAIRARGET